jgi:hypothetical protein
VTEALFVTRFGCASNPELRVTGAADEPLAASCRREPRFGSVLLGASAIDRDHAGFLRRPDPGYSGRDDTSPRFACAAMRTEALAAPYCR